MRSIVEELMLNIMYEVPSQEGVNEFTVTAEMVKKRDKVAELIKLPQKNSEQNVSSVETQEEIA